MKRPRQSVVSACGGGNGRGGPAPIEEPATVHTLAYVVTDCRGDAQGATMRQSLQIRQGDEAPITVVEHSAAGAAELTAICSDIGIMRQGPDCARRGIFHRLGVPPDGSQVVFEVTDEDALTIFPRNTLPTEQKGIFAVRADGKAVRRLGPPSRDPLYVEFSQSRPFFVFSPDGRRVAYTDRGPSRDNEDAVQISTLDIVTAGDRRAGDRRQVTQLPPASGLFGGTYQPFFNDDQTITFSTHAGVDGSNPHGENIVVTVKTDGTGLTVAPAVIANPAARC